MACSASTGAADAGERLRGDVGLVLKRPVADAQTAVCQRGGLRPKACSTVRLGCDAGRGAGRAAGTARRCRGLTRVMSASPSMPAKLKFRLCGTCCVASPLKTTPGTSAKPASTCCCSWRAWALSCAISSWARRKASPMPTIWWVGKVPSAGRAHAHRHAFAPAGARAAGGARTGHQSPSGPIGFVRGQAHQIHLHGLHIQRHFARGLGRINVKQHALLPAQLANGGAVVYHADFVVHRHDADQNRCPAAWPLAARLNPPGHWVAHPEK